VPTAPRPPFAATRHVVGLVAVAAALSALGVVGLALFRGGQPYWLLILMEACIALAGVVGVMFWRGCYGRAPALAVACVAGTVFTAGFLSWLSVRGGMVLSDGSSVSVKTLMLARVGAAVMLGVLAAFEVLSRDRASVPAILKAIAAGALMIGVLAAMYAARTRLDALPAWLVWSGAAILAVCAMGLFCAAVHFTIRAFELGGAKETAAPSATTAPGATSS